MVRLKSLPPRLQPMASRLGRSHAGTREEREAERLKQRDAEQPWRKWYYTRRWKELRKEVWLRDEFRCQQTGILLVGKYPAGNSPVADHIKPHRGDPELFWDMANVQTVSKEYHDREKQRGERDGR